MLPEEKLEQAIKALDMKIANTNLSRGLHTDYAVCIQAIYNAFAQVKVELLAKRENESSLSNNAEQPKPRNESGSN